jgi:hypothetical protein
MVSLFPFLCYRVRSEFLSFFSFRRFNILLVEYEWSTGNWGSLFFRHPM